MSSTVTPYCWAMLDRLSPALIVYLIGWPAGPGVAVGGAAVGEGTGVSSTRTSGVTAAGPPGVGVATLPMMISQPLSGIARATNASMNRSGIPNDAMICRAKEVSAGEKWTGMITSSWAAGCL